MVNSHYSNVYSRVSCIYCCYSVVNPKLAQTVERLTLWSSITKRIGQIVPHAKSFVLYRCSKIVTNFVEFKQQLLFTPAMWRLCLFQKHVYFWSFRSFSYSLNCQSCDRSWSCGLYYLPQTIVNNRLFNLFESLDKHQLNNVCTLSVEPCISVTCVWKLLTQLSSVTWHVACFSIFINL
jgi:hypothetical protein